MRQSACKPGSVWRGEPRVTAIHLGCALLRTSCYQPGRLAWKRAGSLRIHAAPIRYCSRWGLPCRLRCRRRGGLLPHPFTLTPAGRGGLLSVALSLGSPPPDVIRHRVSSEPGLSSPPGFRRLAERPSGRLARVCLEQKPACENRKLPIQDQRHGLADGKPGSQQYYNLFVSRQIA